MTTDSKKHPKYLKTFILSFNKYCPLLLCQLQFYPRGPRDQSVHSELRFQWGELVNKPMCQWCTENKHSRLMCMGSYMYRLFYPGWSETTSLVRYPLRGDLHGVGKQYKRMWGCWGRQKKKWMTYNLCIKEHTQLLKDLRRPLRPDLTLVSDKVA